ncbi:MAG: ABC transporter permease [Bacteroidetes bacterium]|nr:ABC transporter permease [Bacteroidota bacterium]MCL2303008.1 ABC transporter permease [Lentimicrobiaceae bacterium]
MLKYLIEKEFKLIKRNRILPIIIFVMPVVFLLLLPFAADFEVKNIRLVVVDNDHSGYSKRFIEKIGSSKYYHIVASENSYNDAMRNRIERGNADAILEIPQHFERDLVKQKKSTILISANAVDGMKGLMGTAYLASVAMDFSKNISMELAAFNDVAPQQTIQVTNRALFNPMMNYKAYMVPAIMMMLIVLMCGAMPAVNIVMEKETGTIEQMNVTPVKKFYFILAKIIPFWVIGFIVLTLGFIIAYLVYGLIPVGSLGTLYLAAAVFILTMSGIGLVISNKSDTMQQALMIAMFFLVVFILMSGLLTPIASMPRWAQLLTYANPLRYYAEIMRFVYLKGCTISDILPQLSSLLIFAVAANFWAMVSYKKQS